jgi:hypothetical protein
MNCVEVQQVLPELGGSQNQEVENHLKSCHLCSDLVSDLEHIAHEAQFLAETEDPPQRVWVRIAAELRAEGIIRETESSPVRPVIVPQATRRWNAWWLVPLAAALVVAGSVFISRTPTSQPTQQAQQVQPSTAAPGQPSTEVAAGKPVVTPAPRLSRPADDATAVAVSKAPVMIPFPRGESDQDDQQLLDEMSQKAPMMRAAYENEMRTVNSYIRDAEAYALEHPGDDDARRHLMDAYEQKSILYQLALDHVQ